MANPSTPEAAPKVVKIHRFQIGLNVIIQTLVIAAIVAMVNYISFRHYQRWDYSRDKKFELSSQTTNLLANLKKPVKAVIFFSSAADIAPDVAGLLREYGFASRQKFKTEVVDPYRNLTRAQELATKYKIRENDNILILDIDGKSKFVSVADMGEYEMPDQMSMMAGQTQPRLKAFKGEQAVTSALMELEEGKSNKIYYLSGHGEPALDSPDLQIFKESLKRQNIQIAPLNLLNVNSIPEDARTIILCGLKVDLSELELKLLSDFWEKNGRLLVLLNPFTQTPRLTAFLSTEGVVPEPDRIVRTGTFLQMDEQGKPQLASGVINDPTFVILDSKTNITKDLVGMSKKFLGATQSLVADTQRQSITKAKVFPLIQSGEGFWGETDFGNGDKQVFFDPKRDHMGPLNMAVALERGGVEDQRVKVDSSRLVVVGNAELLGAGAWRLSEGISSDFVVNSLNWLLDREDRMGIPPREKRTTTLSLNEQQLGSVFLYVMVLIPGTVAIIGLLTWWQRRS